MRALCVSVHDVAPSTWPACVTLIDAVREVADIPLTLLVVPRFHGDAWSAADGEHSWGENRANDCGHNCKLDWAKAREEDWKDKRAAQRRQRIEDRHDVRHKDGHDSGHKDAHASRREDRGDMPHDRAFDDALNSCAVAGHELALHGYTHLDDGMPASGVAARWLRRVYTTGEGEFAAIGVAESRRRIALGLRWFGQRGWYPPGFVAPAWLLGNGAWAALRDAPFAYTTTYRYLHLLPGRQALCSPSLVYTARNRAGRFLSPPAASVLAFALRRAPLVRLALHPRDAGHPALLRHAQGLIARLLEERAGMTKAAAAAHWRAIITGTAPIAGTATVTAVTSMAPVTSTAPVPAERPVAPSEPQ